VRQPAPVVTIDIPQPEIIVRMPKPEVAVQQAQPQVQVQQAQPQVRVEQPAKPQVQVENAQPAKVAITQAQTQPQVQVEQTGQPKVNYERAEPKVTINQPKGQPTIRVENVEGQANAQTDNGQQVATAEQTGAPQAQMQRVAVKRLDGMDVVNERGEKLGTAAGVVQGTADKKQYLVIKHGGFLGLGEKKTALSVDGLIMRGNQIVVPGLTDDQIRAMPRFDDNTDQFPKFTGREVEFRTASQ